MRMHVVFGLLSVALSAPAQADKFVVAPAVDGGKSEVAAEAVQVVLADLQDQGQLVVAPGDAVDSVPAEFEGPCAELECARVYRESVGAAAVVTVRVFSGRDGGSSAVRYQILVPPGVVYQRTAKVGPLPTAASVRPAWRKVREAYTRGPGPWLHVSGRPSGAGVYVDSEYVGTLPTLVKVNPGSHRVRIASSGHESEAHVVAAMTAGELVELEVQLSYALADVEVQAGAVAEATYETPSVWNYVAGGLLIAVGVAVSVDALARERAPTQAVMQFVPALTAVGAGAATVWFAPIRDAKSLGVAVHGRFR